MVLKAKYLLVLFFLLTAQTIVAQEESRETVYKEPVTGIWINTYGNIRLTNRLFWIAQTHFRFQETDNTPFAGQLAQIYNRHAISYLFSKKFNVSLGGVARINYNSVKDQPGERNSVPEWRIWHQYLFAMPLSRLMIYHRLRIEHRWSQSFSEDSDYIFRNRWRYMFKLKMPIGKPQLASETV